MVPERVYQEGISGRYTRVVYTQVYYPVQYPAQYPPWCQRLVTVSHSVVNSPINTINVRRTTTLRENRALSVLKREGRTVTMRFVNTSINNN